MPSVKSVSKKLADPLYVINTQENKILSSDTVFSIDGYDFADRLLEGVMFKATLSEDRKELTVIGTNSNSYLEDLNAPKWMKVALKNFIDIAFRGDFVFPDENNEKSDLILVTESILQEDYPELFELKNPAVKSKKI